MVPQEIIESNWRAVNERMRRACERSGRPADSVQLVAVTKSVGPEEMRILLTLGAQDLGENRVQEASRKFPALGKPAPYRRHMIGHLQRNKVRLALQHFDTFHSVDSLRLAQEIESDAARVDRVIPTFLQVNVASEETKHGFRPEEVGKVVREILGLAHVRVEGLMTMAPLAASAEEVRPVFRRLRELRDALASASPGIKHLSMGMTQDFEVAIEEGATWVRIGSALFQVSASTET